MPANPEIEAYIRQRAQQLGIDPNVAVAVSKSEALNVFDPTKPDLGGDDRSSFGPFQLHYGGRSSKMPRPGLGDEFTRQTGLKADDPSTWKAQVDFALSHAAKNGWGAWMGAKNTGIGNWEGIKTPATANVAAGDVGGLARGAKMGAQQAETVAPQGTADNVTFTAPPIGGQFTLKPEKTTGEGLGDIAKSLGNQKAATMGSAPQIGMAQYSQGQPIPSVVRNPFQPIQAPMPQMGGGQDLRAILAQLMAQGGGGIG